MIGDEHGLPARPKWATTVEPRDDGRQFSTVLGAVLVAGEPPAPVEILQSETVDRSVEPTVVTRQPAQLLIAGHRHDLDQAAALARLIQTGLGAVLG